MKNFILCLAMFAFTTFTFAQSSIGLFYEASEPSAIGISWERMSPEKDKEGRTITYLANIAMAGFDYDIEGTNTSIAGNGFMAQLGARTYYKKNKGWYGENFLTYGRIKFDETISGINVEGRYSYWSLINPNFGYRIEAGGFRIDPYVGFNWKWEVKGSGIIDNSNIDNLTWRAGIRVCYKL